MIVCPACQTVLRNVPASGQCPKCQAPLHDEGVQTAGPDEMTIDLAALQKPAGQAPAAQKPAKKKPDAKRPAPDQPTKIGKTKVDPQMTQDLPTPGERRTFSIAPRRLSAKSIEGITNSWRGALSGESNPRSSLKIDSQLASGTGASSLVVNLRGIRTSDEIVRTGTGADYELLQVIGKGGMGVVYSARQASVDRMVAVKMIRPNVAADAERREKFLSEAVVTGDLDHPNIVPIYELGSDETNALFYSMKRVQGTPWSHVIAQKPTADNLDILSKVADAVAFAHANGVVHRDLKPENVMLGDFGEVLVMDWGLALATREFRHADFVTRADSMGGTPAYMAPEMVTGPFELIGPPCDIYLLGALLFEIVTGVRPHTGKNAQDCLLAAARNEIQPTDKTGELVDIAYHAMATDPAQRFASVQEFQAAIRDYQSHMESVKLTERADQELAAARQSNNYQGFARALFGFEEAAALWSGNGRARTGVSQSKLAYATSAKEKGDFELGASLLDADNPQHGALRGELVKAERERDARQKWLTRFKQIAAAMAVLVFAVISVSLFFIFQAKNRETAAKQQAIHDRDSAQRSEAAAEQARKDESKQKELAQSAEKEAKDQADRARKAQMAAVAAQEEEKRQKDVAIKAEQAADAARRSEEQAAYVARVGMAAAKIDENAFDTAQALLAACQPLELRGWEWGYLDRMCHQGDHVEGQGTISAVAFAPDGRWFATAGDDRKAHLWDGETAKERVAIDHPAPIEAIDISPDGTLVATGCADGKIRLARADTGAIVRELNGHTDRVLDVAFSPRDGRWLISASRDKSVRLWDTASGRELPGSPVQAHYGWVWSAAFAPDESGFVTAGHDAKVIVWSMKQSTPGQFDKRKEFVGHDGPVFTAAFSPDGREVASGGYDKRVLVWRVDAVRNVTLTQLVALSEPVAPQTSRSLEGHSAPVRSIAFSRDGQYLLSGADDNTIRIWDATTGRPHTELRGHSRPVLSCAISADARHVLSGGQEGEIKLWDIVNFKQAPHGRLLLGHDDAILDSCFSPDGSQIVTASRDHTARIYRADSGESLHTLAEGHHFLASRAVYFDQGRRLVTAGGDKSVHLWDATTGSELQAIDATSRTAAVSVSPDGEWILTGQFAQTKNVDPEAELAAQAQVALWQLDAERRHAEPHKLASADFGHGHEAIVTAVAISPDRRWLYSGDDAGVGKLWDAATGAEVHSLRGHTMGITAAHFTPDGARLLTANKDGTVARWEVGSGRELPRVIALGTPGQRDAHDIPIIDMALSADGKLLLTLSEDIANKTRQSVVSLWNVDAGTPLGELYRGSDVLTSVAFTHDGRQALASGSRGDVADHAAGGIVRLWDVTTRREVPSPAGGPILDLTDEHENVWSAIAAPGGNEILTIGGDGASLWNPQTSDRAQRLFKPHSGVSATDFSADGKRVVTGSSDRRAKIWDVASGKVTVQLPAEHAAPLTAARFSPTDANRLLTASVDGTAKLWDLATQQVLWTATHEASHTARPVHAAVFSPDGQRVLTAGENGQVHIWDAANGQLIEKLDLEAPIRAAAYSPNGAYLLAGLDNGHMLILDARTHRPLVRCSGHTDAISSVAFSSDARRALSGSEDRTVKVWNFPPLDSQVAADAPPVDGKELLTLRYHDQAVTAVRFSPDGHAVLTTSLDGTAVVWQADDWQVGK